MAQSTTPTLTDFLLARIAEDELSAWGTSLAGYQSGPVGHGIGVTVGGGRLRAECEAKRRIVERAARDRDEAWHEGYTCGAEDGYDEILHHLAAVYADYPDYRPEWRL